MRTTKVTWGTAVIFLNSFRLSSWEFFLKSVLKQYSMKYLFDCMLDGRLKQNLGHQSLFIAHLSKLISAHKNLISFGHKKVKRI